MSMISKKICIKLITITAFLMIQSAMAKIEIPSEMESCYSKSVLEAHEAAHFLASKSMTRSLPMFNYVYYADGFCRDQVCTPEKITAETDSAKKTMGADFDKLNTNRAQYRKIIKRLQSLYSPGDLASLGSLRSAKDIIQNGIFITANDMSKSIIYLASKNGQPSNNLRFMVMMVKDGYLKMCPARDGRKPTLPRPVVYSVVAYKTNESWCVLNPENSKLDDLKNVGNTLPSRLSLEFSYETPLPMKGKTLVNAGSYRYSTIDGFTPNELIAMTASGFIEDELASVSCL